MNPYKLSLDELEALEGENVTLPYFNTEVAWQIGAHAREVARTKFSKPVLIDVTLSNGQVAFHSASKVGAVLDNDVWVERKKKTVLRFGKSSFYMGRKLASKQEASATPVTVESAFFVDGKDYATHGGSVPIRAKKFDGLFGTLTVSGLAQEEDHLFALEVLSAIKDELELSS